MAGRRGRPRARAAAAAFLVAIPVVALVTLVAPPPARAGGGPPPPAFRGTPVVLDRNGGWSWFEDERGILTSCELLVGSVGSDAGFAGPTRNGAVDVSSLALTNGAVRRDAVQRGVIAGDDHNAPSLVQLLNGQIIAAWPTHSGAGMSIYTATRRGSAFQPWTAYRDVTSVSYTNLLQTADGTLYDFGRIGSTTHFAQRVLVSRDNGGSWKSLAFLQFPGQRPYVKYAVRGNRIAFITTQAHPDQYDDTDVYAGYIQSSAVYDSFGTRVGTLGSWTDPTKLTKIFDGDATRRPWVTDLAYDGTNLVATFSVRDQTLPPHLSIQHELAVFNGQWTVTPLAFAGNALYTAQPSYTGGVALDPAAPADHVVVSSDVDPGTGTPVASGRNEIWDGRRTGASWTWTAVTSGSTIDQIRPIIPAPTGSARALVWLRGQYPSYLRYSLEVVAIVDGIGSAGPTCAAPAPVRVDTAYDLDGDGSSDLVTTAGASARIWFGHRAAARRFADVITRAIPNGARPLRGDFDGDGLGDILWYTPGRGADRLDLGNGATSALTINGAYKPAVGDFDADGDTDILWAAPGSISYVWLFDGTGAYRAVRGPRIVAPTLVPVAGDFDGDGRTDVFFYGPGAAREVLWVASPYGFLVRRAQSVNGTQYVPVSGDFDGDRRSDILWYAPGAASDSMWRSTGTAFAGVHETLPFVASPSVGDFDGDGRADVAFSAAGSAPRLATGSALSRGS